MLLNDASVALLSPRLLAPPAGYNASYLEDVLVSSQAEGLPTDVEGDDGKGGDLVAADHVLKHKHNRTLSEGRFCNLKHPRCERDTSPPPGSAAWLRWPSAGP